jgi:hypothetical protein
MPWSAVADRRNVQKSADLALRRRATHAATTRSSGWLASSNLKRDPSLIWSGRRRERDRRDTGRSRQLSSARLQDKDGGVGRASPSGRLTSTCIRATAPAANVTASPPLRSRMGDSIDPIPAWPRVSLIDPIHSKRWCYCTYCYPDSGAHATGNYKRNGFSSGAPVNPHPFNPC